MNDLRASILAAQPHEFWFGIAMLAVVAAAAFVGLFRNVRKVRMIEDTPTSRIRSAAQGYVELQGEAEALPGGEVVAPLSQLGCLWYRYSIEERRTSHGSKGRSRTRWVTLESGRSDDTFVLRDATGRCVVDPDGAEVTPGVSQTWYGSQRRPGLAPPGGGNMLIGVGRYRYRESRIHPGPLYVIGHYRTLTTGGTADRQADIGALLREWKGDQRALAERFDRDGDGRVDPAEWQAARRAAAAEVDARLRERLGGEPVSLVSQPENRQRPYLISVKPQHALVSRYRRRSAFMLTAFLALGAAATWAVSVRTGGLT